MWEKIRSIHAKTKTHRRAHGCGAYSFDDGEALAAIAERFQPVRVLELGTALGYTAACLAFGSPQAHIDTIEADPDHVELARQNLSDIGFEDRVTVHQGEFEKTIPTLIGAYDMVFFDGYAPDTSQMSTLRERISDGGILICANLGLASGSSASALNAYFEDAKFWAPLGRIENEGTLILRKRSRK